MEDEANLKDQLEEMARRFKAEYVLVVVTERDGQRERVVYCDLREYPEALAIYDGLTRSQNCAR